MSTTISKLAVLLTASASSFNGAFKEAGGIVTRFGATFAGVAGGIAAVDIGQALAGGVAKLAGDALKLAANAEQAQVSFSVMLGSAEKARELTAEINQFAAATPFQTAELIDATKKLLAFGVAQEQVIPTMRTLGDIAAGLGIPIGELSELYGKARVQGRLMAEDVNQLTGRGIPVIQEFAKQFGVGTDQVRKLVESGKIGFPQLQTALISLTAQGGKFGGLMQQQAGTLAGLYSTLKDSIDLNMTRAGQIIAEKLDLKAAAAGVTSAIEQLAATAVPILETVLNKLAAVGLSGKDAGATLTNWLERSTMATAAAADYLSLFSAGWHVFKAAAIGALAAVVQAVAWLQRGVEWLLEALGADVQQKLGERLQGIADGLGKDALDQLKKAGDAYTAFDKGSASAGATKFFDDLRKKTEAAAAAQQDLKNKADQTNRTLTVEPPAGNRVEQLYRDALKYGEQLQAEAEKAKKQADDNLADFAKGLIDATRTPAEAFAAQMEKINEALYAGLIDGETAARAAEQARAELQGAGGSAASEVAGPPQMLQAGSQDAARFVAAIEARQRGADRAEQIARLQREANDKLGQIARNTSNGGGRGGTVVKI